MSDVADALDTLSRSPLGGANPIPPPGAENPPLGVPLREAERSTAVRCCCAVGVPGLEDPAEPLRVTDRSTVTRDPCFAPMAPGASPEV